MEISYSKNLLKKPAKRNEINKTEIEPLQFDF